MMNTAPLRRLADHFESNPIPELPRFDMDEYIGGLDEEGDLVPAGDALPEELCNTTACICGYLWLLDSEANEAQYLELLQTTDHIEASELAYCVSVAMQTEAPRILEHERGPVAHEYHHPIYGPLFHLDHWPQIVREAYLHATTDLGRRKVAAHYLRIFSDVMDAYQEAGSTQYHGFSETLGLSCKLRSWDVAPLIDGGVE